MKSDATLIKNVGNRVGEDETGNDWRKEGPSTQMLYIRFLKPCKSNRNCTVNNKCLANI